ncbi:MAG: 4-alpha-glucanotransferase [Candidatus Sericytochromatia bacterium]|nr:4-alpha-glucanotransferase [Candidatus Sericytochromatia bacterium]
MQTSRVSGILLHPSSLPNGHGIGDLGPEAYAFVDWLKNANQRMWQVLPLGPTGYGDSPYQSFSAFAGNPLLVDLNDLMERGWLSPGQLPDAPANNQTIDYGHVVWFKREALKLAYAGFNAQGTQDDRDAFKRFCAQEAKWLNDYALFQALKDAHGGACWSDWEPALAARESSALKKAYKVHTESVDFWKFTQWNFFRQWQSLHAYATDRDIAIVGDVPIFVAYDSVDVWANPELFHLDETGHPTVVAGVPPDYFSETGQLWGNPLYRWDVLAKKRYTWWIARMKQALQLYDVVRLDHFRGFAAYWEVRAGEPTAVDGRWVRGPGDKLFKALSKALGADLPIIAEDLGLITPDVEALRDDFNLPGMKILQFAFGGPGNAYLPHNYPANSVAYTGTHDNDTVRGWFNSATQEEKDFALRYLATDEAGFPGAMVRSVIASTARIALIPVQDLLGLGSEARMNTPSLASGNWTWRLAPGQLGGELAHWLGDLTYVFGRTPEAEVLEVPHSDEEIVIHEA